MRARRAVVLIRRAADGDMVRVNLQGGTHVVFKEFTGGDADLDGALALLTSHLIGLSKSSVNMW